MNVSDLPPDAIVIVGLAGRFPGADDVDAFWQNLRAGREGIARLSDEALRAAGRADAELADPRLVKAIGAISDHDCFDAGFFGLNAREAEVLDPQHRVFFETAWTALESAGVDPARFAGSIGVFAGAGLNAYLLQNLAPNPEVVAAVGAFSVAIASDKDGLTQRLAYLLNLRGPAVTVQSTCSTSLVAVQLACQSLQAYQCDLALAGGVSVKTPHFAGYFHVEGGVASPDGHCRPFDAAARGTVPASGCGVVALRRLEDAQRDGDAILAVIRGAAVNNDGAAKVGFTAPGPDGQAEVIALAQAAAQVEPASIGYVEAHGTGTPLGDPIEVAALTRVFGNGTDRLAPCVLGAVKSNLGHLDAAAGVAGLIKAALAVAQGEVPPTLHFSAPNPELRLDESPFFVNASTIPWPAIPGPRRAAVSSFGIGGTNAHVVLEEPPQSAPHLKSDAADFTSAPQLLPLSARSEAGLARAGARLADWLEANPTVALADVARTLQRGRRGFARRRVVRASTVAEAIDALRRGVDAADLPPEIAAWRRSGDLAWPEAFATAGRTVRLPTYAFERARYWIDAPAPRPASGPAAAKSVAADPAEWLYRAAWRRSEARGVGGDGAVVGRPGAAPVRAERVIMELAGCTAAEALAALRHQAQVDDVRELVVLVDGVLAVEGGDVTAPDLAGLIGLGLVLAQERPGLRFRLLDAGGLAGGAREAAARAEFGAPADETVTAWRAGRRWVRGWDAVPVEAEGGWRERGVYLITGGFGRLGLALAGELVRTVRARLVLLGRRGAVGVEAEVRALEAAGGEVLAIAADVADEAAVRGAIAAAESRWGGLHGVIHAAGLTAGGTLRPVAEMNETDHAAHNRPKVNGWRALDAALAGRVLDFRIAISSLSAVLGGVRLGAYAAANATLDACVEQSASRTDGTGWIGVAWGGNLRSESAGAAIGPAEGAEVLRRLVARGQTGAWVVALTDLRSWVRQAVQRPGAALVAQATTRTASSLSVVPSRTLPTRAEAEREVSAIWQHTIGTAPATLEQNLFEAGGDSVSAVQIVARINERFGTTLPVAAFLDQPTVAALAARIAAAPAVTTEADAEAAAPRVRRGALRRERHGGGQP
ncbi:MAG TPA: SDR family NAD(P)-dependent oxidoreductase [Opitutaceae bacterium]